MFVLTSGLTAINFELDNEPLSTTFDYIQENDFSFFNATVYSNYSINSLGTGPGGMHNLTIISPLDPMSFDFAIYTYGCYFA